MDRITLCLWLVALAVVAAPRPCRATELHWSAPAGCPDEAFVRAEIERLLGRSLADTPGPLREAQARASMAGPRGWQLRLETVTSAGSGQRTLDASSCEQLASAAAVIIALAIDPEAVAVHRDDPPAPPVSVVPPVAPPVVLAPRVIPPPRIAPRARVITASLPLRIRPAIGVAFALALDAEPGLAAGIAAHVGLGYGLVRVELGGAYFAASPAHVAMRAAGGDVQLAVAEARACLVPLRAAFELGACVSTELGVLSAAGFGVDHPDANRALWLGPGASALGAWVPVRWFALRLDVGFVVPVYRPVFYLANVGDVFQPPPIDARATLGAEIRLP